MAPPSTGAALQNLTVADADALNCGVCFLPLKPPIFQCPVGHVLCSQCSNKLLAWDMYCYVCCIPLVLGYRRSHDMEKLVESIRAPCPNAAYGCDAKPAYYHLQPHLEACLHQPCHCPECGFVGGTKTLLAHFTAAHQWPCTTHVRTGESFHMELRDGFNVADGATTKLLFLVMVSRESLGRAISAICVKADVGENEIYGLEHGSGLDEPGPWIRGGTPCGGGR